MNQFPTGFPLNSALPSTNNTARLPPSAPISGLPTSPNGRLPPRSPIQAAHPLAHYPVPRLQWPAANMFFYPVQTAFPPRHYSPVGPPFRPSFPAPHTIISKSLPLPLQTSGAATPLMPIQLTNTALQHVCQKPGRAAKIYALPGSPSVIDWITSILERVELNRGPWSWQYSEKRDSYYLTAYSVHPKHFCEMAEQLVMKVIDQRLQIVTAIPIDSFQRQLGDSRRYLLLAGGQLETLPYPFRTPDSTPKGSLRLEPVAPDHRAAPVDHGLKISEQVVVEGASADTASVSIEAAGLTQEKMPEVQDKTSQAENISVEQTEEKSVNTKAKQPPKALPLSDDDLALQLGLEIKITELFSELELIHSKAVNHAVQMSLAVKKGLEEVSPENYPNLNEADSDQFHSIINGYGFYHDYALLIDRMSQFETLYPEAHQLCVSLMSSDKSDQLSERKVALDDAYYDLFAKIATVTIPAIVACHDFYNDLLDQAEEMIECAEKQLGLVRKAVSIIHTMDASTTTTHLARQQFDEHRSLIKTCQSIALSFINIVDAHYPYLSLERFSSGEFDLDDPDVPTMNQLSEYLESVLQKRSRYHNYYNRNFSEWVKIDNAMVDQFKAIENKENQCCEKIAKLLKFTVFHEDHVAESERYYQKVLKAIAEQEGELKRRGGAEYLERVGVKLDEQDTQSHQGVSGEGALLSSDSQAFKFKNPATIAQATAEMEYFIHERNPEGFSLSYLLD